MPRHEKNCFDWSLTYSPEGDCSEVPKWVTELIEKKFISHALAITERHTANDKWHIHVGFRIIRSYKSDYAWWQKFTDQKKPELEVLYHDNICGLVGGYLTKSEPDNVRVLLRVGFTDEQLELGKQVYGRAQLRKRIKSFADAHVGVHPNKWVTTVGAIIAETGCTSEEADVVAAGIGFSSTASKAPVQVYSTLYVDWKRSKIM